VSAPSAHPPLPTATPGVLFQALEDGAVLFSPATEIYFGLNHVGARIWELLPPASASFDELCDRLRAAYPDAGDTVAADVRALLDQLALAGLVTNSSIQP